jgi:enoyl-[acyl-carrier protein] reductase II
MARFDQLGTGALQKSVKLGDVDNGSVMSGQIAGMVNKEQSCKEIIEELMSEFSALTGK